MTPYDFCRSFPPSFDDKAELLILGSMPGAESLRQQQYYAFRFNVFWRIMGTIFGFDPLLPYPERLAQLRRNHIALWDVLASCCRAGSSDSAIRDALPNDIPGLLRSCPRIRRIICNGGTAGRTLHRAFPDLSVPVTVLISTSPAAATLPFEEKLALWKLAVGQPDARGR